MSVLRKPLGLTAKYVAAVLERDPSAEFGWRWRRRPLSMFDDESVWATWNARFAGKPVGKVRHNANHSKLVIFTLDGVQRDLRRIEEEFGEAVDAITGSSVGLPDDENTGGNAGVSGSLARILHAATRSGFRLSDLTVLSVKRDPYRMDRPVTNREGQWFAEWLDRLFPSTIVHLRGFHYALVAHGGVMKPDGSAYENTDDDYVWLIDDAAKAARWLGHVGFERIIDQRNDPPDLNRVVRSVVSSPTTAIYATVFGANVFSSRVEIDAHAYVSFSVGGEASLSSRPCEPSLSLQGLDVEQPYCFAFFGEKSSLREVLEPVAEQYRANLYLCSGEISDTLIYHMAKDADADGRPLVVFTFSDFDPAGHHMPISIGRKLQALRDLYFQSLRAEVVPVSLTLEQVISERLPTTPVKVKERRARAWNKAFGPALREAGLVTGDRAAQVEIDALAVLRPEVLTRITHEKIALYRDETIDRRVRAATNRWHRAATQAVAPQIAERQERLDEIKEEAIEAVEAFNAARDALAAAAAEAKEAFEESVAKAKEAFDESVDGSKEALEEARERLSGDRRRPR